MTTNNDVNKQYTIINGTINGANRVNTENSLPMKEAYDINQTTSHTYSGIYANGGLMSNLTTQIPKDQHIIIQLASIERDI